MQLRASIGLILSTLAAALVLPGACAPDSGVLPGKTTGEGGALLDGFGCTDPVDSDGDFVADSLELAPDGDTDGDLTADKDDLDSDGDTVPDAEEASNSLLAPVVPGYSRDEPCDPLADTDADGIPDLRDLDSDNDGVSDKQEMAFDPDGRCRVLVDCDGDGVLDLIELAAGTDPTDSGSKPDDPGLYFVLPYKAGEQTKDFTFSTSIDRADIYFLIDTTQSMQPTINELKASLSNKVLPAILNGNLAANPPIPPIGDAWLGIGDVRDVPWDVYGQPGDSIYRHRFQIGNPPQTVVGNVAPPEPNGNQFLPPQNVTTILNALAAAGGGDGPEATTQALWIAATNQDYAATIGGLWSPVEPHPAPCPSGMVGVPCFRTQSLPIFLIVTDAAFHNGPVAQNAYNPMLVGGTKTYAQTIAALNAINAKVVGVPVAGGNPGAARADLTDLAMKTSSLYHDAAFGGTDRPLVPQVDVASGQVSDEVVKLLGLLAGAGLHDVTTTRSNYDCAGGIDCTGDGNVDLEYHNPIVGNDGNPFDASQLITQVAPVDSPPPAPYSAIDATTFHDVRGSAQVTFRVHAKNDLLQPTSLVVLRAIIRVVTPAGQLLGGAEGIKLVYFVIPESLSSPE